MNASIPDGIDIIRHMNSEMLPANGVICRSTILYSAVSLTTSGRRHKGRDEDSAIDCGCERIDSIINMNGVVVAGADQR